MREPLKDKNRLEHIISAIDIILDHTDKITFEELVADKMLYGGIVYHTMIIGEAVYKLSHEFVSSHPDTPWGKISSMRHHLVHGYYQVDAHIIWLVIQNNLRPLREQVSRYLSETNWETWEKQQFTSQSNPQNK